MQSIRYSLRSRGCFSTALPVSSRSCGAAVLAQHRCHFQGPRRGRRLRRLRFDEAADGGAGAVAGGGGGAAQRSAAPPALMPADGRTRAVAARIPAARRPARLRLVDARRDGAARKPTAGRPWRAFPVDNTGPGKCRAGRPLPMGRAFRPGHPGWPRPGVWLPCCRPAAPKSCRCPRLGQSKPV